MSDASRTRTPPEDVLLGYGAVALIVAGAAGVAATAAGSDARAILFRLLIAWSAAILCFLSGVRRGTSFYTPGGARLAEIASFLWIFAAGLAALVAPDRRVALASLVLGYASVGWLDYRAAHAGEAPRFFARLRPVQMAVAAAALAVSLVWA